MPTTVDAIWIASGTLPSQATNGVHRYMKSVSRPQAAETYGVYGAPCSTCRAYMPLNAASWFMPAGTEEKYTVRKATPSAQIAPATNHSRRPPSSAPGASAGGALQPAAISQTTASARVAPSSCHPPAERGTAN